MNDVSTSAIGGNKRARTHITPPLRKCSATTKMRDPLNSKTHSVVVPAKETCTTTGLIGGDGCNESEESLLHEPTAIVSLVEDKSLLKYKSCYRTRKQLFASLGMLLVFICVYTYIVVQRVKNAYTVLLTPSSQVKVIALTVGDAFMVMAVPLTFYQIASHLCNFVEPRLQSQIVRILFMIPIYSVGAYLSLEHQDWSIFISTARDFYEAYVIYCFTHLLYYDIVRQQGGREDVGVWLASKPQALGKHVIPFCCLPDWKMGGQFLLGCKWGVFQYLVVRSIFACTAIWDKLKSVLNSETVVEASSQWFFLPNIINFVSQTFSLYVLFIFYRATKNDFGSLQPMGKFLAIKSIVFLSWWQSILIEWLLRIGVIEQIEDHKAQHIAQGMQDLLVVVEMLVAAVAFLFVFPVRDFVIDYHYHVDVDGASDLLCVHKKPYGILYALYSSLAPAEISTDWDSWLGLINSKVRQLSLYICRALYN